MEEAFDRFFTPEKDVEWRNKPKPDILFSPLKLPGSESIADEASKVMDN